ncbi:DUF6111 family protein [Hyphobacterium sp. HN65]|uniref:DUF6111 family protein n=1 Tax=Hyphobacterium lacteum TaxID=3116575 RepID=A0ABU7LRC7_9PROT|nr:DUF6111 family protein [Hyphobacterium sp. HN65]MEE2526463.1 DUF6111 family protein [Hyphobacterium sp. HN65]
MIRLAFLEMLLFLTPFIAFALWRLSMQATAEIAEHKPAPVIALSAIGGFLAAAGFVFLVFASDTGDSEHTTYVPPRLGEGGIERAQFHDNPGEEVAADDRNFGERSDYTGASEEDDDDGPSRPR